MVALGLVVITNSRDESPVAANTVSGSLTQEEFNRLNTTALDALVPAVAIAPQMDVDPFLYWNSTALEAVVPAASGKAGADVNSFLYLNTTALEHPRAPYIEPANGPR